jgi:hypothetical protein
VKPVPHIRLGDFVDVLGLVIVDGAGLMVKIGEHAFVLADIEITRVRHRLRRGDRVYVERFSGIATVAEVLTVDGSPAGSDDNPAYVVVRWGRGDEPQLLPATDCALVQEDPK